jgi:hypothetical protein
MTDGTNSKAVDYGRIYRFDDESSLFELVYYCSRLWEDKENDAELEHFFNINNITVAKTNLIKVFEKY